MIDWVQGKNLLTNEEVWLPASAAYDCTSRSSPFLYRLGTNGLASGNHLLEANTARTLRKLLSEMRSLI